MPERLNGPVSKTGVSIAGTVGSNPTLSAMASEAARMVRYSSLAMSHGESLPPDGTKAMAEPVARGAVGECEARGVAQDDRRSCA